MDPRLQDARNFANKLKSNVTPLIMGNQKTIEAITIAVLAKGHILLEGVPGTAKTFIANAIARSLGLSFTRIQFTPDLMPSDIVGTNIFEMQKGHFHLVKGPVFADIVLGDEINRAPPKTQAALLEAMQERQVSIDGTSYPLPENFTVLATQNPIEQEGTYPLPEAQLDRFMLKYSVPYPEEAEELAMLQAYAGDLRSSSKALQKLEAISSPTELTNLSQAVNSVHVDDNMFHYVNSIIRKSRQSPFVLHGAGPRAGIHLLTASRWHSCLQGRAFVTPDDIHDIAEMALAHRLVLTAEAELEGYNAREVLQQIISEIEVPR